MYFNIVMLGYYRLLLQQLSYALPAPQEDKLSCTVVAEPVSFPCREAASNPLLQPFRLAQGFGSVAPSCKRDVTNTPTWPKGGILWVVWTRRRDSVGTEKGAIESASSASRWTFQILSSRDSCLHLQNWTKSWLLRKDVETTLAEKKTNLECFVGQNHLW